MEGKIRLLLLFASTYILMCTCTSEKRLVLHSDIDIGMVVEELRREINATKQENAAIKVQMSQEISAIKTEMTQENAAIKAQMAQENTAIKAQTAQEIAALTTEIGLLRKGQSSTYIRWGRTVCDGNGTEKVYSGYAAGSPYNIEGGASSFICLPERPSWAQYKDGLQDVGGYVSGVEYEPRSNFGLTAFGKNMLNDDAPCVVCRTPRPTTLMIPGSTKCYSGWTMEYTGYLMTDHHIHKAASDYACLDKNPEAELHGEADQDGKLFYFAEVQCGSLPCQEYPQGRELACVVCSK